MRRTGVAALCRASGERRSGRPRRWARRLRPRRTRGRCEVVRAPVAAAGRGAPAGPRTTGARAGALLPVGRRTSRRRGRLARAARGPRASPRRAPSRPQPAAADQRDRPRRGPARRAAARGRTSPPAPATVRDRCERRPQPAGRPVPGGVAGRVRRRARDVVRRADGPVARPTAAAGRADAVVERAGCDSAPIDPATPDGRLRLTSYVWPDQLDRLERLRGAPDLAARVPATVHKMAAGDLVQSIELQPGTSTVLSHSVVWQYLLDRTSGLAVEQRLADLGAGAGDAGRLAHLRLEPQRRVPGAEPEFLVRLQTWPGGQDRVLGVAHPHGIPTTWE